SESKDARPTISARRHTEPAKLTRLVRGELDWIVMKALEKDRNRRYDTANGFAADVQRYLADEPVLACPPSVGYRLRKFVRRNKGPVLAASLVLGVLAGGIVGTAWGLVHALAAEKQAIDERDAKEQARKDAVAAGDAERQAKELAQKRLEQIAKANEILGSIFQELNPRAEEKGGPGLRVQLSQRVERASRELDGEGVGSA